MDTMNQNSENTTKIGVVICAYDRDAEYMGDLARSLRSCGYYTVIGYDAQKEMPTSRTVNSCDYFFSGGGHLARPNGHLRNMRNGHRILVDAGCDYSLCVTGDAVIEEPDMIPELIGVLDGNDSVHSQWGRACGTMIYFGRASVLYKALRLMKNGNPQNEKKLKAALNELGASYKIYPCRAEDKGIWETIGFHRRHGNYMP